MEPELDPETAGRLALSSCCAARFDRLSVISLEIGQNLGEGVPANVGEDNDAARGLVDQAKDAELFLYPGEQHLFADSSLPSYDPDAAAVLTKRVLHFLSGR